MQLVRFAYVDPRTAFEKAGSFAVGDVEIVTWSNPDEVPLLVSATVQLQEQPDVENGVVSVPREPRRQAERALETATRILTIATGSDSVLSSPNLAVAFRADDESERNWLAGQTEIAGFTRLIAEPDFVPGVDLSVVAGLGDRLDGVALLSEAVASQRMLGRFRDVIRVFERAFTKSSDRLVPPLAELLSQRPVLAYSKTEVKRWITQRHRATHADRLEHEPALEADVRRFIARILLAAYEVVLNKRRWGSPSTERRDLWTPRAGPLDPHGRSTFVAQHSAGQMRGRVVDRFEAYPIRFGTPGLRLPQQYWPSEGPTDSRTERFSMRVVGRSELAVAGLS
jgi:hypothetical protein